MDVNSIKEELTLDDIYTLLLEWGGEPKKTAFGLTSTTICHNLPGEGSRKLYYYANTRLFRCYTGCSDSFDIFALAIKVYENQFGQILSLKEAIKIVASRFGLVTSDDKPVEREKLSDDWEIFSDYERIQEIRNPAEITQLVVLKEYPKEILSRFNYSIRLVPWERDGISREVMADAQIGYYIGSDQITIPHFDKDGRLVGIRGRFVSKEDVELYGKYRPLYINKTLYNHPLGLNLYNFNKSKENIKKFSKAIIGESEKMTLQYRSYFGPDKDISVACCGSNISSYQMQELINAGAKEVIVAFDRQFQKIGDKEYEHLMQNFQKLKEKYSNLVTLSFIIDLRMITDYKDAPTDKGPEIFLELYKRRRQ